MFFYQTFCVLCIFLWSASQQPIIYQETGENRWINAFPKGIITEWNAHNLVQDWNSSCHSTSYDNNRYTFSHCSLTPPKPERCHAVYQRHSHFSLHQRWKQQQQPHWQKQQQPHWQKQQQQQHCEFLGTIFQLNNKPLF